MSMLKIRRRKWLIDNEIQVGLGVRLALCLAAYTALFLAVSLVEPVSTLFSSRADPAALQTARWELHNFLTSTIGPLLIATACMVLHSVLILHRLAGPVLRVRRGLGEIAERDLTGTIKLRKGDLLESVVGRHNEALAVLKRDMSNLAGEVVSADDLLADGAGMDDDVRGRIRTHLDRAAEILGRYRLDPAPSAPIESAPATEMPTGV